MTSPIASRCDLIVITGPTAVGKTAVAVELARRLGTEIVSADSMQVYKGLTIGTAKPVPSELGGVRYHLIDCVSPDYQYNLGDFVAEADRLIAELRNRQLVPIVCGGTCMYIKGLLHGIFTIPSRDPQVRAMLARRCEREGLAELYQELQRIDPGAVHIRSNDRQRILRALEVYYVTGSPISTLQRQFRAAPRYAAAVFILELPREELYRRIDERVDRMMAAGLLDEVQRYLASGYSTNNPAVRALGYAELIEYLHGRLTLEDAIQRMKRKTRQFAKRQLSWFRAMNPAYRISVLDRPPQEVAQEIEVLLKTRFSFAQGQKYGLEHRNT